MSRSYSRADMVSVKCIGCGAVYEKMVTKCKLGCYQGFTVLEVKENISRGLRQTLIQYTNTE